MFARGMCGWQYGFCQTKGGQILVPGVTILARASTLCSCLCAFVVWGAHWHVVVSELFANETFVCPGLLEVPMVQPGPLWHQAVSTQSIPPWACTHSPSCRAIPIRTVCVLQ